MSLPPLLPVPAFDQPVSVSWTWDLQVEPAVLWPMVVDTNRVNSLANLPTVQFQEERLGPGRVRRYGQARFNGLNVRWDEHPYEWVEPRSFGVTRVFHNGPLLAYRTRWELTPRGGGTRLVQTVDAVPRLGILRPLAKFLISQPRAGLDRAYRRVESELVQARPLDPAGPSLPTRLAALLRQLEAGGHPAGLAERLVRLVAFGDPVELQSIRPFLLADAWGAPRREMLTLCLSACAAGLLQRRWSHLCPGCRGQKGTAATLGELAREAYCASCDRTFAGTFDATIELSFRPERALREVPGLVYCVGGPGNTRHVVMQAELAPGEERLVEISLPPGPYRLQIDRAVAPVDLQIFEGFDMGGKGTDAGSIVLGPHAIALNGPFRGPDVRLRLRNDDVLPMRVALEHAAWGEDAVTGALVTALPEFRMHFPEEMPGAVPLPIGLMTFVCARPRTELVDATRTTLARYNGGVFEASPAQVVAAFYDPLDAVEAALAVQQAGLAVGIGLDVGPCQAEHAGGQLAYAGAPVDRACLLALGADHAGLVLPEELAAESAVVLLLGGRDDLRLSPTPAPGCVELATLL